MLALAGAGFISALLMAVWGYEGAQKIVHAGILTDLQAVEMRSFCGSKIA